MASDEYEFVPTKDFEKVQSELQKLKQNPFLSKVESKEMKNSIDTLHLSVDNLLTVFKQAHQELTQEERESRIFKKELEPITDRFEKIEANQETIANGVVVVSDAVTKLSHKVNGLHTDFEKIFDLLHKVDKKIDELSKSSSDSTSGSKVTRKYFTTRQYQQPNVQASQSSSNFSASPSTYNPGLMGQSSQDSLSSSLQNAQMDATLNPSSPGLSASSDSFYASPISTTVESTAPPMPQSGPIGSSQSMPRPPLFDAQSSPPMPPPGPQNAIPPLGSNGLSGKSDQKSSSGFSLFKK